MFRCSTFYEMGMECDTEKERLELRQSIMEYGLFWKEPKNNFKVAFVNVRFILKKSKKISEERSGAWKKWGAPKGNKNAVRNEEKQTKQAKTSKTSESDSNSHSYSNSISSNDKIKYLEYVYLSSIEYEKLIDSYWKKVVDWKIDDLNNYIWQKWKDPYKSHYHTILSRLKKDWVKKLPAKSENESWVYENLRDQDVYLQELIKWKQK